MTAHSAGPSTRFQYPPARREDVEDAFFGTRVADPYRWLEAIHRPEVGAWVEAQNELTRRYLDALPQRGAIERRFRALVDYEKFQLPFRAGPRWFYFHNSGLQNQFVLYVREGESGEPRAFFDPNALSADGTVALGAFAFTESGRYFAYSTQEAGSDWQTWRVRDVETGRDLDDVLRWSKFSGASWREDRGFYYAAYDPPQGGGLLEGRLSNHRIYFHALGTPQAEDTLVYERPDHPDWYLGASVTTDARYVFVYAQRGTDRDNHLYVRDLRCEERGWRELFGGDAHYEVIDNDGSVIYLLTTRDAPNGRVASIDLDADAPALRPLVAQSEEKLEAVSMLGDRFYASYLRDACSIVRIYESDGRGAGVLPLPGIGTASPPHGKRRDPVAYFTFESFTAPETIYRYDPASNSAAVYHRPAISFDPSAYETKQVFAVSADGTRVPMFITAKRGLPRDASAPALLYAYGGFGISLSPAFSRSTALWLEMGGVYALANLRGGGEYGEAWHEAGRCERKQNVFDDFFACARLLIDEKYTRPDKLAIQGGSNGGLLVGAAVTQQPELFGAALCDVGVLDMLRFQKFTAGNGWVPEYGSAEASQVMFESLHAYSPYHRVREGVSYPATLISTGDHDDRVFPAHSYKFAAELQRAQAGKAPILLRVDVRAGHGSGKPLEKVIAEVADALAFLAASLDVDNNS